MITLFKPRLQIFSPLLLCYAVSGVVASNHVCLNGKDAIHSGRCQGNMKHLSKQQSESAQMDNKHEHIIRMYMVQSFQAIAIYFGSTPTQYASHHQNDITCQDCILGGRSNIWHNPARNYWPNVEWLKLLNDQYDINIYIYIYILKPPIQSIHVIFWNPPWTTASTPLQLKRLGGSTKKRSVHVHVTQNATSIMPKWKNWLWLHMQLGATQKNWKLGR